MATYYWVGGSGTWDISNSTHWSLTSGGSGGAGIPTSTDDVVFDSASSASSYTVTVADNFVGTASYSTITSMTSTVTIATVVSGAVTFGSILTIGNVVFRVTSLGTGSGGVGTYNCAVLRGVNSSGSSSVSCYGSANQCANISFSGPSTGTLAYTTTTGKTEIAGSVTVASSGVTFTNTAMVLTGASSHTITTNSVSMPSVYLCGVGTYTLGSAYSSAGGLFFSFGTFTTANYALTVNSFDQDSSGTRTINLGSSTVTITASGYPTGASGPGGTWANVTFNAGTSQVNFTASFSFILGFGNKTWYNVSFTSTEINPSNGLQLGYYSGDNPTFNNLTFATQTTTQLGIVILFGNITVNGTFTINVGATAVNRIMFKGGSYGTANTITVAAFTTGASDIDWRDITIAGAVGTISGTRFGNCGGCTNITFDAAKTVYWNLAGTQNWSAVGWASTSGGTPNIVNFPLAQDTAVFDNAGSAGTITLEASTTNAGWNLGSLNMSARTTAMTLNISSATSYPSVYGSTWINGSGVTLGVGSAGAGGTVFFRGRGITQTVTSAGKSFPCTLQVEPIGGGLTLADAMTISGSLSNGQFKLNQGTLTLSTFTLTVAGFESTSGLTRTIAFGTGNITCTGGTAGLFNCWFTGNSNQLTTTGTTTVYLTNTSLGVSTGNLNAANAISFYIPNYTGTTLSFPGTSNGSFKNLDFTGSTGTWNSLAGTGNAICYGDLTLGSGMTTSTMTSTLSFAGTFQNVYTNGVTINFPLAVSSGTCFFWDAITSSSTFSTSGSCSFSFQESATFVSFALASTGSFGLQKTLTLTGSGTCFSETVNRGSSSTTTLSQIIVTSSSPKTVSLQPSESSAVPGITQAGSGALTITSSTGTGTVHASTGATGLTNTVQPATISITGGITVVVRTMSCNGTSGNLITIGSTNTTPATLQCYSTTGAGAKSINSYCSVSYITGSTTTYGSNVAGVAWRFFNSTNGGNNTNLVFNAVTYYWVGGSGTWDAATTTNWSLSSGGAGNAGPPTSIDNVVFDTNSNATAYTVTVASGAVCYDMNMAGPTTGQVTCTGSGLVTPLNIYGSLTLSGTATNGGVNWTYTSNLTFASTNGGNVITSNGVSFPSVIVNLSGVGGGWSLGGAIYASGMVHTAGAFYTNNYNVTAYYQTSGTSTRLLDLGSTTWNASTAAGAVWLISTVTNYTLRAGTSTIQIGSGGNVLTFGGLSYYNVTMNVVTSTGSTIITVNDTATFANLTYGSASGVGLCSLILAANITVTGTLTLNPTGTYNSRVFVCSSSIGTQRTITAATTTLQSVDFRDIAGGGTGTWSGVATNCGDCGGNAVITYPTAKTVYWNLAGSQGWTSTGWATTSGGTPSIANFPLAQDTVIINDAGSADTLTINKSWNIGNVDMSARTSAITLASGTNSPCLYGNWTGCSSLTLSGTGTLFFNNRSIKTVNSAGVTFTQAIKVDSPSGGIQLVTNNLITTSTNTTAATCTGLLNGTIDLNNLTFTVGYFESNNSNTRAISFGTNGIIIVSSSVAGTSFNMATLTGFTTSGTSNVTIPTPSSSSKSVSFGGTGGGNESNALSFYFTGTPLNAGVTGVCRNLDLSGCTAGAAFGNLTVTVYGNLIFSPSVTISASTSVMTFGATSGTKTITTNGLTLDFPVTFNGLNGTFQFQDNFILGSTRTLTLTNGTIDLNGKTINTGASLQTAAGTKNITFNGGTIVCPAATTTAFNNAVPTGFTTTAGTGMGYIEMSGVTAKTFVGGGSIFNCTLRQTGVGALTITGANSFRSITNTVQPTTVTFTASTITTILDSVGFALSGTAGNLVTIGSTTTTAFTITRAVSGTNTNNYCSVSYMTGTTAATGGGTVTWQFVASTNGGNNTNLTFITAIYYWVGGSGTWDATTTTNWSLSSGGAGNAGPPASGDSVIFDTASSSGSYTVTIGTGAAGGIVTIGAPASGALSLAGSAAFTLGGNLTIAASGVTNTYTGAITVVATSTLTTNGVALASNISFNVSGGTLTLGSSLTTTGTFTFTQTTLSLVSYTLTTASFSSSNTNTRTINFGTGNITVTGSGTSFDINTVTGLTVSGTPVVNVSYSGSTAVTVNAGSSITEANALSFNFTTGTYPLSFLYQANERAKNVSFTGFNGTLGATGAVFVGGNLTLSTGMTLTTSTNTFSLSQTTASQTITITSAGKTLDFPITINYATTSTLQLSGSLTMGSTRLLTLTQGTLNLSGSDISCGSFDANNSNTRAITFGTNKIILNNGGATLVSIATATSFTYTGTGGFSTSTGVASTFTFGTTGGTATNAPNLFISGSANHTLTTGSYFKTIDFTGYTGTPAVTTLYLSGYILSTGGTFTNITARMVGSGSITSNGKSIAAIDVGYGTSSVAGYSSSSISNTLLGGVGTALLAPPSGSGSAGTPVGVGTGTADDGYWPITPGWNISFNGTNYTTMYAATNFYVTFGSGSTVYSALTASNPALPKIAMSAADRSVQRMYYQLTGTTPNRTFWWRMEGSTTTSGTLGSPTMVYEGYIYENSPSTIDIVTGVLSSGGLTGVFSASAQLLAVAGMGTATTGTRLTYSSGTTYPSPTTTIVDNLNVVGALTFTSGVLTTTSGTVSAASFDASTTTAKTLVMGSGTWTITGSGATAWNVTNPSFLTVTPGTSTIAMSSASAKTFVGGGKTWGTLSQTGAGTLTITGANAFNDLTASGSGIPSTILFTAGTTTTFTNFTLSGTAGNLITIGSVTAAVHTLSKTSGIVNASYLNISYSTATGGATWNAINSTNSGNNTGWTFTTSAGSSVGQLGMLAFFF
jgi:hypothetical protein